MLVRGSGDAGRPRRKPSHRPCWSLGAHRRRQIWKMFFVSGYWRWHYSASQGTSQIQFWRIQIPRTSLFIFFVFCFALPPTLECIFNFGSAEVFHKYKKHRSISATFLVWEINSQILQIEVSRKEVCRQILQIRIIISWRLGSIFIRKHGICFDFFNSIKGT